MNELNVQHAGLSLGLNAIPHLAQIISGEIGPFFLVLQDEGRGKHFVDLQLRLESLPESIRNELPDNHETVVVDTSLYKHLASSGKRWDCGRFHVVRIDLTDTYAVVERENERITLFQPDPDLMVRDSVRAIKGLFTVAIEARGGIQLHSSSVVADGKGVLLLGDMWQGKTTLLLELLSEFHVSQLSCDTTVVMQEPSEKSRIACYGWPSPFSVSHGAMADYPELYSYFPEERKSFSYDTLWKEAKKSVLTSNDVVEKFQSSLVPSVRELAICLIIRFKPAEETSITRITSPEELEEHVRLVYLGSRDPIYHNWHGYLKTSDSRIDENIHAVSRLIFESAETYVLTWAPSAVSLMKRIPFFASSHKHLRELLKRQSSH